MCRPHNYQPFPKQALVSELHLLETLWEKDKFLVKSNFSFSHSVFQPFCELTALRIKLKIVICLFFQLGESLEFVIWERVKLI